MVTLLFRGSGRFGAVLVALSISLNVAQAQNQQQPQPPQTLDEAGFVEAVSGNSVTAKLGKTLPWVIGVTPETAVHVHGSAETSYLHAGLSIKFSGELDKKGTALAKEIEQIEIFTPTGKGGIGVFDISNPDKADKPVRSPADGASYEIRTKIISYKPEAGEMTVTVNNKKIVAKVAATLAIMVNSSDVSLAQEGDEIKVKGIYEAQQKPNPQLQQPGYVVAQSVNVTLAKPLAAAVKKGKRPAIKPPRGLKAPDAAPATAPAPFSK